MEQRHHRHIHIGLEGIFNRQYFKNIISSKHWHSQYLKNSFHVLRKQVESKGQASLLEDILPHICHDLKKNEVLKSMLSQIFI